MSRGKHLSLEEARNKNKLAQFAKEHPSEADKERFDALLNAMSKNQPANRKTSGSDPSGD
jgi:hypothetical protein